MYQTWFMSFPGGCRPTFSSLRWRVHFLITAHWLTVTRQKPLVTTGVIYSPQITTSSLNKKYYTNLQTHKHLPSPRSAYATFLHFQLSQYNVQGSYRH